MPGPLDPFTPGQDETPYAGVDPGTFDKIRNEWGAFLSAPQGRAAIMSMGLALTQPPSFGDNAISQIGRAVGAGGTSAQLMDKQEEQQRELDSKIAMRDAQAQARLQTADAATLKAEAANARLGTAGAHLELRQRALENAQTRSQMASRLRLSQMYQNEIARINKENANAKLMGQPEKPILPFPDWVQNNPALRSLGLLDGSSPDQGGGDETVPFTTDTVSTPQMPTDKSQLKPNTVYNTPRGPLKWTGTGFVPP